MTNLFIPYPVIKVYHLEYDINNRFNYDETMYFKTLYQIRYVNFVQSVLAYGI